jgi:hypothetical protein
MVRASNPVGGGGGRIFPHTSRPAHTAFFTLGTGLFPGVKRLWSGFGHPPPSSAEAKERIELYLYSLSGSVFPVLVWNLPSLQNTHKRTHLLQNTHKCTHLLQNTHKRTHLLQFNTTATPVCLDFISLATFRPYLQVIWRGIMKVPALDSWINWRLIF